MTLKDQRFYFFKEKSVYLFLKKLNGIHLAHLGELGAGPWALGGGTWTVRQLPAPALPVPSAASVGRALPNLTRLSRALSLLLQQGLLG